MKKLFSIAPLLACVIGVQILCSATDTLYYLTQMTMSAYYSLLIIGLCVLMGYAGQISLGHAGFFAIGGYISAALTTHNLIPFKENVLVQFLDSAGLLVSGHTLYGEDLLVVSPGVACGVAIIAAALIAVIIGIPVLKLKGHYLAMATLGFGIIIYRLVLAVEYFGEADGISEVPAFPLFAGLSISGNFADRVIMGHLYCHEFLPIAIRALDGKGIIHYHESTPEAVFDRPIKRVRNAAKKGGKKVEILRFKKVKNYSPGVLHFVVDAYVY